MAESTSEVTVPVKVSQPEDNAPPTLAEPASGPAAELPKAVISEKQNANDEDAGTSSIPNGENKPDAVASTDAQPEASPIGPATDAIATEDTEMKDATQTTIPTDAEQQSAEINGTPASKSKRKSSTGVPEHRSKTLKKKQSKPKITHLDAEPGDLFFARLRSYPPWPSVICDEEMLPSSLLSTRPVTAKQTDGTYKEAYADGGKKVTDRTYPIMFLYTNEFAWIPNTDLNSLEPSDCKDVAEKGKSKALVAAYGVAAENHDLQYFKDMLTDHARAVEEDEERRLAKEAEKAAKADRKKGKPDSKAKEDEDVEMEDAEPSAKKSTKKRKKDAESDDEEPEKTPKTTKLKLTTKTPPVSEKKAKEPKSAKPKSEKKKKVAEEEPAAEEKEPEPAVDPVEARKAKEKEVLFLRHKLQKCFLSRDQAPQEDEMPQMNTYFTKLETLGAQLEVSIIRNTKINKVLKALVKLNTIPRDEEYQFRKRSVEMLGAWGKLLGAEPADADKPERAEKPEKPEKPDQAEKSDKESNSSGAPNGVHKEAEEAASEKVKKTVDEPKDQELKPEEAIEKVSAEASADAGAKAAVVDTLEKEDKDESDEKEGETKESGESGAAAAGTTKDASLEAIDKAPQSAEAAAEATEVVKSAE